MEPSHKIFLETAKDTEIHFALSWAGFLLSSVLCAADVEPSERFSSLFLLSLSAIASCSTPPPAPTFSPTHANSFNLLPPSKVGSEPTKHPSSCQRDTWLCVFTPAWNPLPTEHLTRFHTSSHPQSPSETQSSCLSSVVQTSSVMSVYLPPLMCT